MATKKKKLVTAGISAANADRIASDIVDGLLAPPPTITTKQRNEFSHKVYLDGKYIGLVEAYGGRRLNDGTREPVTWGGRGKGDSRSGHLTVLKPTVEAAAAWLADQHTVIRDALKKVAEGIKGGASIIEISFDRNGGAK